jgi:hypothetical protein
MSFAAPGTIISHHFISEASPLDAKERQVMSRNSGDRDYFMLFAAVTCPGIKMKPSRSTL